MDALHNQVFFPSSLPELFSAWTRFADAVPFAGGTELLMNQGSLVLSLPRNILSLDQLDELRRISRTERYLEIGAMVTINELRRLGKSLPDVLARCLRSIASPYLRNLITVGGNLCHSVRRLDMAAPMIALDARYELRTASTLRWVSATRFSAIPGPLALNPQELLTRIRIPLDQWHYSMYKKFTGEYAVDESGGSAVFLARIQKNILMDLRVVFAGQAVLRDKHSETLLSGKQLPLDRRDAGHFTELWQAYLSAIESPEPMLKAQLLNFIESCILGLSD
jgi:CO/xanthine dehydrogenase FAD-binding subunit